jgi:hypothetical protein
MEMKARRQAIFRRLLKFLDGGAAEIRNDVAQKSPAVCGSGLAAMERAGRTGGSCSRRDGRRFAIGIMGQTQLAS